MDVSCRIRLDSQEKNFQIWNPNALLPVDNEETALKFLTNLAIMLRSGFQCTQVDDKSCVFAQNEVEDILRVKALQIVRFAESHSSPFEVFIGHFVKTDMQKIRDLKKAVCNYDLLRESLLLKIPSEISVNIFNDLDTSSFVRVKATCHALKKALPALSSRQESEISILRARYEAWKKEKIMEENIYQFANKYH